MFLTIQPDRDSKLQIIELREDFREQLNQIVEQLLDKQPDSLRQVSIAYDINEHHLGRIARGQEANPPIVKLLKTLMALRGGGQAFIVPDFAAKNLRITINDGGWDLPIRNTFKRAEVNQISAEIIPLNFPRSEIYKLYDFETIRFYLLTRFLFCAGWRMELAVGNQTAHFNHTHDHPVNADPEKYYQEHESD